MSNVKITVITVCFNAENDIENTIDSVLSQDYRDYEYIIKDGCSNDRTVEIAERYRNRFSDKGIDFEIISSKDSGIYDAMNESLSYAHGDWVIFINAGDELYDGLVLSKISPKLRDDIYVLYGDVMLRENGFHKLLRSGKICDFCKTNPICHQGAFTRLDIAKKYRFNTDYKIAADFDMFLRIYVDSPDSFVQIDNVISYFLLGGVSSKSVYRREKEFDISRKNNQLKRVPLPIVLVFKSCLIEMIRSLMIGILGDKFYSKKRGWR